MILGLKVFIASFLASKTFKVMGKKDFADIIMLTGWLSLATSIILFWRDLSGAKLLYKLFEGIKDILI